MNEGSKARTIGMVGVVMCLVGIALSVDMLRTFRSRVDRMQQKAQQVGELHRLRAQAAEMDGMLRAVEPYAGSSAGSLETLKDEALPGEAAEVRERERVTLTAGWTGRQADVQLKNVPIKGLMRFIRMAEEQRLPWRLRSCTIRAASDRRGTGDATLVMETIQRVN